MRYFGVFLLFGVFSLFCGLSFLIFEGVHDNW